MPTHTVDRDPTLPSQGPLFIPITATRIRARPEPTVGTPVVLIVDDDEDVRDSLVDHLEHHLPWAPVVSAPDATTGLRQLERHAVACVVTDLQMPGLDGLGFLVRARAAGHSVPFVLTSAALTGPRSELACSMVGPANVFHKPSGLERLVERVTDLVSTQVPRLQR